MVEKSEIMLKKGECPQSCEYKEENREIQKKLEDRNNEYKALERKYLGIREQLAGKISRKAQEKIFEDITKSVRIKRLKKDLDEKDETIKEKNVFLLEKDRQITELNRSFADFVDEADADKKLRAKKQELKKLSTELHGLRQKHNKFSLENTKMEALLNRMRAEHNEIAKKYNETLEDLKLKKAENLILNNEVAKIKATLGKLEKALPIKETGSSPKPSGVSRKNALILFAIIMLGAVASYVINKVFGFW